MTEHRVLDFLNDRIFLDGDGLENISKIFRDSGNLTVADRGENAVNIRVISRGELIEVQVFVDKFCRHID